MSARDTDMLALVAHGLAVGHGAHPLIRGIDLAVHPGQVVALIGPNGSGKTTLLKTLAGHLAPLAGDISVFGQALRDVDGTARARTIACLFTERPRTELMTCQDIVEAGRYPYTGSLGILDAKDREAVRAALTEAGIWDIRDRDFAHMSDGQRQRTLLARALVQMPRLLLLDEPTSYLDIHAQIEMLALLRRHARERNMAIVASLHEIELAQKAADHVVCIRDGHVIRQGTPDRVMTAQAIEDLYGLDAGSFEPAFGSVELPAPTGAARVFVLAGAGTGAPCFRALQRAGIPFATGVLYEHDIDCVLARHLAGTVIAQYAYEPIDEELVAQACRTISACGTLICCIDGENVDATARVLIDHAVRSGVAVFRSVDAYLGTLDRG